MRIEIRFDEPTAGWWDGGKKHGGVFESRFGYTPEHTEFGAWELNYYFNVKTGRTEKETVGRARRYLKRHCKKAFTFVEEGAT